MTIHWKVVEQYVTVVLFVYQFQFIILENLSILDLALSGMKGFQVVDVVVSKKNPLIINLLKPVKLVSSND